MRATDDILTGKDLINEGAKRYSSVEKGYIREAKTYEEKTAQGKTFYRTQTILSSNKPVSTKINETTGAEEPVFPEKTHFALIEMDTINKPDFKEFENYAQEIYFSGQRCVVSKRNAEGKGTGKKQERCFARSAFCVLRNKDGQIVHNQDNKPVFKFISTKENAMKNEPARAGREHVRCHFVNNPKYLEFNKPLNYGDNGYQHKFTVIYTPNQNGNPVREKNNDMGRAFMRLSFVTKEPLSDEKIRQIREANALSINYMEHVYSFKNKNDEWQRARVCEVTNLGFYLKRNKEIEADPRAGMSYTGEVFDITSDGFNTKDAQGTAVNHKWSDIDPSEQTKISNGTVVTIQYDNNRKVSNVEKQDRAQTQKRGMGL